MSTKLLLAVLSVVVPTAIAIFVGLAAASSSTRDDLDRARLRDLWGTKRFKSAFGLTLTVELVILWALWT